MKSIFIKIFFLSVIVLGAGTAALRWFSGGTASTFACAENEGLFIAEVGDKEHLELGDPHPPYNSNPPTSGWHTEATSSWGVSEAPIPDEMQVHNLEHGGILVQYKTEIDGETKRKLGEIVKRYKSKVLMAPRPNLDRTIALTAWTYLDKFDEFDECRIVGFIKAHINEGPEFTPD